MASYLSPLTPDTVSLAEGDEDPLVVRFEHDVQREAEGFLGLCPRSVAVVLVDQAASFIDHIHTENRHVYCCCTQLLHRRAAHLGKCRTGIRSRSNLGTTIPRIPSSAKAPTFYKLYLFYVM